MTQPGIRSYPGHEVSETTMQLSPSSCADLNAAIERQKRQLQLPEARVVGRGQG